MSEAPLAESSTVVPVDSVSIVQFASEHLPATRFRLRLVAEPCPFPPRELLDRPPAVSDYFHRHLGHEPQEVMVAAYLDTRHRLIGWQELFRGTVDRIKVEPRQLLQTALMVNAQSFLICHCHPSGDTTPSTEDMAFTERVREASAIVGIPLADHMIVGHGGCLDIDQAPWPLVGLISSPRSRDSGSISDPSSA